jgi:hypothetical protein
VIIGCNTTAAQAFAVTSSRESGTFGASWNEESIIGYQTLLSNNINQALNVSAVLAEWNLAVTAVISLIAPVGEMSLFLPSVFANNLTQLRIVYFGTSLHEMSLFR